MKMIMLEEEINKDIKFLNRVRLERYTFDQTLTNIMDKDFEKIRTLNMTGGRIVVSKEAMEMILDKIQRDMEEVERVFHNMIMSAMNQRML